MISRLVWQAEQLDNHTWRNKVFGGWIVYAEMYSDQGHVALTSTFIADPEHKWIILPSNAPEIVALKPVIPECLL